jgi:hypothetical protein
LLPGQKWPKETATISLLFGPVAQLVEQRIENPRVDGSIPSQATKQSVKARLTDGLLREKSCGISSVGRAIPCQGIGREFESLIPLHMTGLPFSKPQKIRHLRVAFLFLNRATRPSPNRLVAIALAPSPLSAL